MRRGFATALAAAIGMTVPACADDHALSIYNWADYTSPDLVKKFETETGIRVTLDTYDNNETLLAKLHAGGGSGYDIAVASGDFVTILAQEHLVQRIDGERLPHFANLAERWRSAPWDPGHAYSMPWNFGLTSVAVDTAAYHGPLDTLGVLFDPPPELAGRLQDYSAPSELVALALTYMGRPPCSIDSNTLRRLEALLLNQKSKVKVYASDGSIDRMVSGEVLASQMWTGDALRARQQKPSVHYVFAKEGVVAWADNMVVPAGAPHPEAARRWMDFMLLPENAALQTQYTMGESGVSGVTALLPKALADAPEHNPPADLRLVFTPACPPEATRAYDRIMTKLRQ